MLQEAFQWFVPKKTYSLTRRLPWSKDISRTAKLGKRHCWLEFKDARQRFGISSFIGSRLWFSFKTASLQYNESAHAAIKQIRIVLG